MEQMTATEILNSFDSFTKEARVWQCLSDMLTWAAHAGADETTVKESMPGCIQILNNGVAEYVKRYEAFLQSVKQETC